MLELELAAKRSTAAPVGSGSQGSGGSGSGAPAPPVPQAPASVGTPLGQYNAELQGVWDRLRPQVLAQLDTLIGQRLNSQLFSNPTLTAEVLHANLSQRSDLTTAPGFTHVDSTRLVLRAPVQGSWEVVLAADLRVTLNVGGVSPAIDIPLEIVLEDLSLELEVEFDDRDPTRPTIRRVGQPQVDFQLRIDSPNALAQQLIGVLSGPANWVAQQALSATLLAILPNLQQLQGLPGPIPGDGAPPLLDTGTPTPFAEVVDNVELKLRQAHIPHGTLLMARMDTPANDTWLDAYTNTGRGVQGSVVAYNDGGDSAIWTGHYLAAESYRYALTGSSEALDNVGHTLKGIGALLDVNGGTGLLARVAAPESSLMGQRILSDGVFRQAQLYGETWVGRQGGNGISRDQYSGVFFGLGLAYEHVPAARLDAERRVKQMLDYLIAHDWYVDEDRPPLQAGSTSFPTFWFGVEYQKLAFLLTGHRMDPARYSAELAAAGPLTKLSWFGAWTGVLGLESYYKYNLSHIGLHTYFRLETDPGRWQDMRRAYAIIERYVGHHRNAHFDLIQTSIDPSAQVDLFPSTREALRQFLGMCHRDVAPPVVDLSGVTWVTLPTFGHSTRGGTLSLGGSTAQYPTEPLPMQLRQPGGDFIWQRDPFSPATPNGGDAYVEKNGLDLLLPYWMGRHQGAF